MDGVFKAVLGAGIQGSVVIAVVALLRLILKKVPKKYICLLWILAGLRLLMPFSVESNLSLQPDVTAVSKGEMQIQTQQTPPSEQIAEQIPVSTSPAAPESEKISPVGGVNHPAATRNAVDWEVISGWIWLMGVGAMGLYCLISYGLLKRRVREAVRLEGNIWVCAGLGTAFILGFVRPRIYLPVGMAAGDQPFVLRHEQTHLRRGDHWVKLMGFLALAIHWFNPLVWLGYLLLCRDLEMACDEQVVSAMDLPERKAYSAALLNCSAGSPRVAPCPVAFGETSVKARIMNVLNYKKPAFWAVILAVAAIVFVAVCFLTDPVQKTEKPAQSAENHLSEKEDGLLDEVEAALEEFKSRESYHAFAAVSYDHPELVPISNEYWMSGGNWIREYRESRDGGDAFFSFLEHDGVQYQYAARRGEQMYYDHPWYLQQEDDYSLGFWPVVVNLRSAEIARVSEEATDGGKAITVVASGNFWFQETSGQETTAKTYVFYLDGQGKLTGADTYSTFLHNGTEVRSTAYAEILDTDSAAISARVQQAIEEKDAAKDWVQPGFQRLYEDAFYATFDEDAAVYLADLTRDGGEEMIVITESGEGVTCSVYTIWKASKGPRIYYTYLLYREENADSWYLRKVTDGWNLAMEVCGEEACWKEFYLVKGTGTERWGQSVILEGDWETYRTELNARISNCCLLWSGSTESDGGWKTLDTTPASVFSD